MSTVASSQQPCHLCIPAPIRLFEEHLLGIPALLSCHIFSRLHLWPVRPLTPCTPAAANHTRSARCVCTPRDGEQYVGGDMVRRITAGGPTPLAAEEVAKAGFQALSISPAPAVQVQVKA